MAFVMNTLKGQLPGLIEKFEPEMEKALRENLRKIRASNPQEASLFLTQWVKLNKAVQDELSGPAPVPEVNPFKGGKSKKRTRRLKHRK
jgi:hypothetical protein